MFVNCPEQLFLTGRVNPLPFGFWNRATYAYFKESSAERPFEALARTLDTVHPDAVLCPTPRAENDLVRSGVFSGGCSRGKAYLAARVQVADAVEEALGNIFYDAETSGGLAMPREYDFLSGFRAPNELGKLPLWLRSRISSLRGSNGPNCGPIC